jgi:hypothetical protein
VLFRTWKIPVLEITLFLVLCCFSLFLSCGKREAETEPFTGEVKIYFTADTRGYLEPCGCASGVVGGLARRASYIESQPGREGWLLLDAGNIAKGSRQDEVARFRFILEAMETLSYDVATFGAREVTIPTVQLLECVSKTSVDFVSANVLSATNGEPIVRPFVVLNRRGLRIGVTGVSRKGGQVGEGLRVEEPLSALLRWVPELRPRCDLLICLAALEESEIRSLVERLYEVDVFLGGDVTAAQVEPERIGNSYAAWVGDRGTYVGKLTLALAEGEVAEASGEVTELSKEFEESPTVQPILDAYLAYLETHLFARFASDEHLEVIGGKDPEAADRYIGVDPCGESSCHPDAYRIWKESGHAHALETLEKNEDQFDSGCVPCHVVGFGARDGFQSVEETSYLGGVQCEACHGRARNHVKQVRDGVPPNKFPSRFRAITPNSCMKCHDQANSPEFAFADYWEKIEH